MNYKYEKRPLSYTGIIWEPIMIVERDGENLVPTIANGKSYEYFFGYIYDETSYFGYLNKNPQYQNYEDYKSKMFDEMFAEWKENYQKAVNKDYFDSTKELADEFKIIFDRYKRLENEKTVSKKKLHDQNLKCIRFPCEHKELNRMDIRFNSLGINTYDICDGYYGEEIIPVCTDFYDRRPYISYEKYKEFLDEFIKMKEEEIRFECKEEIIEIETEFNFAKNVVEEQLKDHDKVGWIQIRVCSPQKMKEIECNLSELNIDAYMRGFPNTIYWFKK